MKSSRNDATPDWLGVSYGINTIFGALISASLNFIISDRFVFTSGKNQPKEAYFPEALTPAGGSPPYLTRAGF